MRFSAAVAAGPAAIAGLKESCAEEIVSGAVTLHLHEDLAIATASACRWIDTYDDGAVLVVLDGRLHNLWSPDTGQAELVLQRYRARGADVASGLLGDFVLIVLDRRSSTLFVARDPVGVRPWFMASMGRVHGGASDLAAVAQLPWVHTRVNELVVIKYLAIIDEAPGETFYSGIGTLRPGETWSVVDGRATRNAHHQWELEPELEISWEEARERCRAVLEEVVRDRLRVSSSATSELSGGLDSSSLVGTLALLGSQDLLIGRLIFDGPRADERTYSDAVIDHWGLRALSVPPRQLTIDESAELTRRLRRPVPDPNFTMFGSLHRAFREEGRFEALTGVGGDDAFLAMGIGARVISAVQLRQAGVLRFLTKWGAHHVRLVWPALIRPTLGYATGPWRGGRSPRWISEAAGARAGVPRLVRQHPVGVSGVAAIDERLSGLTSGYIASILESRAIVSAWSATRESHPFLDPRFILATYGLDPWWPTRQGHNRALEVDAFGDRLPAVIAQRRSKAEFSEVFWPHMLRHDVLAAVRSGPLRDSGWLDHEGFDDLVFNAKEGKANAAIPLSRCVLLDQWMRTH